jgi:hypothetical protein
MAENVGGISASVELEEGSLDASLARIRASLTSVAQQINALNVQFAGGGMSVEQYVGKMETLEKAQSVLTRQSKSLEQQIRATNAAAASAATGSSQFAVGLGGAAEPMGRLTVNSAALTRGIVDLSRGFEDFTTGGFLGVLNNLPGMTMNIAMGFGVAAEKALMFGTAVSVVATASFALYKNWGQLQALLGTGMDIPALKGLELMEDRLKSLDKRIDELRGKGKLSLPELGELNAATDERTRLKVEIADERAFQGLSKSRPEEEKTRGDAFAKAVAESGGMAALDSLAHALEGRVDAQGRVGLPGAEVGTPAEVARGLFLEASRGNEAALKSIMDSLPGSDPFRERVRTESPEYKAWQEGEDRREKEGMEAAQREKKRNDDYVEALREGTKADEEENQSNWEREMKRKIDAREPLTPGERMALPPELRKREGELEEREGEQRVSLSDRIGDLQLQRKYLMNPERVSQRMGLDQYDSSIAGMTGLSEESKRLDRLIRLNEDLNRLMQKRDKVGARKPR